MGWLGKLLLASVLAVAAHAQVTLNFQDLTLADYGVIPTSYGATLDPRLSTISYRTFQPNSNTTLTNYLEFWNSGYGDLTKVAFPSSNGFAGEISFVPQAGYGIRLLSFDMAGWPDLDRNNLWMRLIDGSGNVLLDYAAAGAVPIQGDFVGARHSSFTPNLFTPGTLRIQWGTDWDVGIDNIRFEVVAISAVPEPPVWLLIPLGAAAMAWRARRRRQ